MTEVREYLDAKGNSPYAKWFDRLNATAAVKVATATHRMEQGNFSNVKVWVPVSMSTGLISVLAIGFTSARTGTGW